MAAFPACTRQDQAVDGIPTPSTAAVRVAGDEITLSGRVTVTYGAHVFAVGSGRERVIVVVAGTAPVAVGSEVEVSGRVRTFRRRELEEELGMDLGPEADALEGKSSLVARTVRVR